MKSRDLNSKSIFKKNAQVSIFVIIAGIILLIGTVAFFVTSSTSIITERKDTFSLQEYTQTCIEDQTRYALKEIAQKGGWYYTKDSLNYVNPNAFDALVSKAQGFNHPFYEQLPYWRYYDETSNNYKSNIPALQDENDEFAINNQLERLIEETINVQCLQNYQTYENVFDLEIDFSQLDIRVSSLNENFIDVEMELPILAVNKIDGAQDSISLFQVEVENTIRTPYFMAYDTILAMQNNSFIERKFIDSIYAYQKPGSSEFLPPFYDFEYDVADYSITYAKDKKPLLQNILNVQASEIINLDSGLTSSQIQRVKESENSILKPMSQYHKNFFQGLENSFFENSNMRREYQQFSTDFAYDSFFPMSFKFSNGVGGGQILKNKVFNENLLVLQIKHTTYQAGYDITTPILAQFRYIGNNPQDDITFNLPIEINIKNNNPLQFLINEDFNVQSLELEDYTIAYCDEKHFISEDVVIDVYSREVNQNIGVQDVEFLFTCSTHPKTICQVPIREVTGGFYGTKHALKLPINCPSSELRITKDGYLDTAIEISPSLVSSYSDKALMEKPKELKLDFTLNGERPSKDMTSMLLFQPLNNPQYTQVFQFNSDTDYSNQTITLIPDTYEVISLTFDESSRTIPGESGRKCSWTEELFGCKDIPDLPGIDLEGWMLSDYKIDNYVISSNQLLGAQIARVRMQGVEYPKSYDDMQVEMPVADHSAIRIE